MVRVGTKGTQVGIVRLTLTQRGMVPRPPQLPPWQASSYQFRVGRSTGHPWEAFHREYRMRRDPSRIPPLLGVPERRTEIRYADDWSNAAHTAFASSTPCTSLNLYVFAWIGSNSAWRGPALSSPEFSTQIDRTTRTTADSP